MPRIETGAFQRERKRTKSYLRMEGQIGMYVQDGTEAILTMNVVGGHYKGEEVEIDASPFIGDIDDGVEGKDAVVLASDNGNGKLLGRYISVERKRGREECFEGAGIIISPDP